MPNMEAGAAAPIIDEEEIDGKENEESEEDADEDGEEDVEEDVDAGRPKERVKSETKEARPDLKVVVDPEKQKAEFEQKADAMVVRLENTIAKLTGVGVAEGKKLLAEARQYKKDLKIKLAKLRKGGVDVDFAEELAGAESVAGRAEKLTQKFEIGTLVKWQTADGKEMRGVVAGLNEKDGSVIVKTEKNPGGFAIAKSKLEKISETPQQADVLIGAATDFDSLIAALEKAGALRGSDGKIYSKESLVGAVTLIRDNPDVMINSPMVNALTRAGGLRYKLIEIMRPREVQGRRDEYAEKNAHLVKNFSGITGWMNRLVNRGGYREAVTAREAAYEQYAKGRAELVSEQTEKLIDEQIALADAQAEAFQNEKGWGRKLYDQYKKLGRARLIITAGLVGGGVALAMCGAPAFACVGVVGARRLLGGVGSGVGSYDLMNSGAAKINLRQFALSKEKTDDLEKFKNEKGLSFWHRLRNTGGARDTYNGKLNELRKAQTMEKAPELSDEDLQKSITYFEAVAAWNGKKPSADPTYMALMGEKAKRYKKALNAEKAPDAKPADKRPFEEQVAARRKEKTAEAMVTVIDSLKQRYLVDQKLFEKMRAVKGTPEERKNSSEYAAWTEGRKKLAEIDAKLPPDIQTFLQKYSEGKKHPSMAMLIPKMAGEWKAFKPDEIDESKVWQSEWTLNPELQAELNELLDRNALLQKDAEDEVREAMTSTVETVEAERNKVDKIKVAVLGLLDAEMRKQDVAVEARRRKAVYADAAMKAAAAAIGLVVASGVLSEWLSSKFKNIFGGTAEHVSAKGAISDKVGHMGTIEPVKVKLPGEFNPDDYTGQSIQPEVHEVVAPWKPNVLEMQKLLAETGHSPGGFDGIQGKLTTGAIKAFQAEHGLTVTGKASKSLMAALRTAAEEKAQAAGAPIVAETPLEGPEKITPSKFRLQKTAFEFNTDKGPEKQILQEVVETKPSGEEVSYDLEGNKIEFQEAESDVMNADAGVEPTTVATEPTPAVSTEAEASVEQAPVEQAAETAVAAKEAGKMSVEFSSGHVVNGKVGLDGKTLFFSGSVEGVGYDDLVSARILRPNWSSVLDRAHGIKSLMRSQILQSGKQLILLKEAMGQAALDGNDELAKAISRRMHSIALSVERSCGDVYQL